MAGTAAKPWMMFYPQDWRADESLRLCSLAARGLWVEMLALMHRSERYGYLLVKGKTPTDRQLAALVGGASDEVADLLAELEEFDVFSRDRSGTIYSRRMIRDEKRSKTNSKNGKKGWEVKCGKQSEKSGSPKPPQKPPLGSSDRPQSPEARVQGKEPSVPKNHSMPEGWQPAQFGEGTKSRGIVDSWPADAMALQVERFTAHHVARRSKFSDWQAAWKTWVLNSVEFARPKPQGGGTGAHGDYLDHHLAERRRVKEWEDQQAAAAGGQG